MNVKLKSIGLVFVVVVTVALAHSCFKQKLDPNTDLPKIDRAQLCLDGGAAIDTSTNECICRGGTIWNGVRCDVVAQEAAPFEPTVAPPQPVVNEEPTVAETEAASVLEGTSIEPTEPELKEARSSHSEFLALVQRACRIGNGTWLKNHDYCHCPNGQVLMGRRCRPMNGRMMNDVCLRAVNKGTWNDGICGCSEGEVFSPARGGCMKTPLTDKTLLRYVCENSMNQGYWDEVLGYCTCPKGKLMIGETCESKSRMSSASVCESSVYGGKWNSKDKRCECPNSKIWANQSCLGVGEVDAETACISQTNRGTWIKERGRCACPNKERWIASKKICIPR